MSDNREDMKNTWRDGAQMYEKLTGGVTRRFAEAALNTHLPPLTSSTRILDSACGPGIVTELILDRAAAAGINPRPRITAIDVSEEMVEQVKIKKEALCWTTVEYAVLDATELEGLDDSAYDAVVMNFGLFALPQAEKGVAEMKRVLKPGGVAIATTWKYSSPIEVLERAVQEVRPEHLHRVWPISKDWLKAEKLRDVLVEGGFRPSNVEIGSETGFWVNDSLEGFVEALNGPYWKWITKDWSDEDMAKWKPTLLNFAGETEEDGSIKKEMIAWVGVAKKDG